MLRRWVKRIQMKVVADDCPVMYSGQPHCTHVVNALAQLGFLPIGETPCWPGRGRSGINQFCELEIVFERIARHVFEARNNMLERQPYVYEHHNLAFNGCTDTYKPHDLKHLKSQPPMGEVLAFFSPRPRGGEQVAFVSADWTGERRHSSGRPYLCPCTCASAANQAAINCSASVIRELTGPDLVNAARCPWARR